MIIVCLRDPDASNDFIVFAEGQPAPRIVDVDYGYADLHDEDEFADWAEGYRSEAQALRKLGTPNAVKAAEYIESLVDEAVENYQS